jgi:hypothetical protein
MGKRSELIFDHIGGGAVYASGVLAMADVAFHPVSIIGYYLRKNPVGRIVVQILHYP